MRPTRWRRSTHVLIGLAVLIVVAAVVAVAAVVGSRGQPTSTAQTVKPQPALTTPQPGIAELAESAPTPKPDRLAATLAPLVADPNLGIFTGRVTDAATGTQLWAQGANQPMQPASTNKVLTTAAALLTLDRSATLSTTVLTDPDQPGLLILKGGGDPTLSAAAPGQPTWYKGAARLSDLVKQVRDAGVAVKTVQVDTSAFSGPTMAPGWDPLDIQNGDIAPIESVMLDGGRTQPVSVDSQRSPTPALDAGRALAAAFGVSPAAVSVLPNTPATAKKIAEVQSPPLIERLRQMMSESDNVMAESIGREVAAAVNRPESFDGAVQAVLGQLRGGGIDTSAVTLVDSSGLSVNDRLTALTLDGVVTAAAGDATPKLRPMLDLLPIAGGSGTLSNRFLDTDAGLAAAGLLRAKTGSLTGTNALAGIVTDTSGRVLTFALISNNAGPTGRTAIDAVAAALRSCGCGS